MILPNGLLLDFQGALLTKRCVCLCEIVNSRDSKVPNLRISQNKHACPARTRQPGRERVLRRILAPQITSKHTKNSQESKIPGILVCLSCDSSARIRVSRPQIDKKRVDDPQKSYRLKVDALFWDHQHPFLVYLWTDYFLLLRSPGRCSRFTVNTARENLLK